MLFIRFPLAYHCNANRQRIFPLPICVYIGCLLRHLRLKGKAILPIASFTEPLSIAEVNYFLDILPHIVRAIDKFVFNVYVFNVALRARVSSAEHISV